ncbi:galactosyltransferase-related protein [Ochrobactrum sp. GPK 3]
MKTTVVIPYRPSCDYRAMSMPAVKAAYEVALPGVEVKLISTQERIFNRAAARNAGVAYAKEGVVVIADSDILPNKRALLSAVAAATEGGFHLAYDQYRNLIWESTRRFYRTPDADLSALPAAFECTDSTAGIIVIRVDEWERAGGMDERFIGWGFEDTAFACQVRTFLGPINRHEGVVNHLWHPSAVRVQSEQYQRNKALYERYAAAEYHPSLMELIISERS